MAYTESVMFGFLRVRIATVAVGAAVIGALFAAYFFLDALVRSVAFNNRLSANDAVCPAPVLSAAETSNPNALLFISCGGFL